MYICVCHAVTDHDIRTAADNGITSLEELGSELRVGTCCGRCKDCANQLLQRAQMEACDLTCRSNAA
ncbi:MAG: (2Fe-2S)-binding protein [Candidatus Thiodiazotropha taylori]|nr:(2Fe-2S)-binding protein [Candidatus Thiodiazotropha taylori]RLW67760.1 MAG: (2Fe-2S)-binding protein [gamma proteobacterium symbiont of Stewartia floridana]MCG8042790.1 (2Fe-2S)-binding protein [Candidatus Thiodiazotropha taylori]MCG8082595.1 (2Fe-2S)-binding protein [Candidatus Thiodiazotropha taylori]MCG8107973.1 (2Fe-2S)-binding protein [Candidatus Thiodiazotropha taylori]